MKLKFKLIFFIFITCAAAQKWDIVWNSYIGGNYYDEGFHLSGTTGGGFIITGQILTSNNTPSDYDLCLVRTDSSGNVLWSKNYGGKSCDIGRYVLTMPDGGFVVSGCYDFSYVWILRFNADGDTLWTRKYFAGMQGAKSELSHTSDGGFIACSQYVENDSQYALIVRYDANGKEVFKKKVDPRQSNVEFSAQSITTITGGFVVGGGNELVKLNENGDPKLWQFFSGSSQFSGYFPADSARVKTVRQLLNGDLIVSATCTLPRYYADSDQNADIWFRLIANDSKLSFLKGRLLEGIPKHRSWPIFVEPTPDTGFIVNGYYDNAYWVAKFDQNLAKEWNLDINYTNHFLHAVTCSNDGNYILCGRAGNALQPVRENMSADIWIAKIAPISQGRIKPQIDNCSFHPKKSSDASFDLYSITGRKVFKNQLPCSQGVYFKRVKGDRKITFKKVTILE